MRYVLQIACIAIISIYIAFPGGYNFDHAYKSQLLEKTDSSIENIGFYEKYQMESQNTERKADFSVVNYDMQLFMLDRLYAKVHITADKLLDAYDFTLYKECHVLSIKDNHGNPCNFDRNRDTLTVYAKSADFDIWYVGTKDQFYVMESGCNLPGYAFWYPRAGIHSVIEMNNDFAFTKYVDPTLSNYRVRIYGKRRLFTNLIKESKWYTGKSDGLSIFSGFGLKQSEDKMSLQMMDTWLSDKKVKYINQQLENLKEEYLISLPSINDKRILFCNSSINDFPLVSVFSDYLLIDAQRTNENQIVQEIVSQSLNTKKEKKKESEILAQMMVNQDDTSWLMYFGPIYAYNTEEMLLHAALYHCVFETPGEIDVITVLKEYLNTEMTRMELIKKLYGGQIIWPDVTDY